MKIDIFTHIIPPEYKKALYERADSRFYYENWDKVIDGTPALTDIENRLRILDTYGVTQVLTIASPAFEEAVSPEDAVYLAKKGNDEMAELINTYPDKFVSAAACVPLDDMEAALREVSRAIDDLGFKGIQIYTPVNGKPLDSPEFESLYETMARYDLPIWIHPARSRHIPDYPGEEHSRFYTYQMFGWPYETTAAMVRLVFSGIMDRYPGIKFITHHCGAMLPFFSERLVVGMDYAEQNLNARWKRTLQHDPVDYFKRFYADTALNGNAAALNCGLAFFGTAKIVFATDYPYDNENGERFTRDSIASIDAMDITDEERQLIYEGNARKLLKLE